MTGPYGVDRRRIIEFLINLSIQKSSDDHNSLQRLTQSLTNNQLSSLYREIMRRGKNSIIHRYERRVGNVSSLCYQNSANPRICLIFFHGFQGSPYDFATTVKSYFDSYKCRVPTVWVLPAGLHKDTPTGNLQTEQEQLQASQSSSRTAYLRKWSNKQSRPQSPFNISPTSHQSDNDLSITSSLSYTSLDMPDIDPAGGYKWWDIPALTFAQGRERGLRKLMQALRHNIKPPPDFPHVRQEALTIFMDACRIWDIPASQVFLAGFSQGAMLVSDLLISSPKHPAAAIILSGAPISRKEHLTLAATCTRQRPQSLKRSDLANAIRHRKHRLFAPSHQTPLFRETRFQIPVFLCHGIIDPIVPFPLGKYLKHHLSTLGFTNIHFETFTGGHDFPLEIATKLFQWLARTSPFQALQNRASISSLGSLPEYYRDNTQYRKERDRRHIMHRVRDKMAITRHQITQSRSSSSAIIAAADISHLMQHHPNNNNDDDNPTPTTDDGGSSPEHRWGSGIFTGEFDWESVDETVARPFAELFLSLQIVHDTVTIVPDLDKGKVTLGGGKDSDTAYYYGKDDSLYCPAQGKKGRRAKLFCRKVPRTKSDPSRLWRKRSSTRDRRHSKQSDLTPISALEEDSDREDGRASLDYDDENSAGEDSSSLDLDAGSSDSLLNLASVERSNSSRTIPVGHRLMLDMGEARALAAEEKEWMPKNARKRLI